MGLTAEQRTQRARLAAVVRWSRVSDRTAATAPARAGFEERFERQVDPDGALPPEARAKMAEKARQAHFIRMNMASAKMRRARADSLLEAVDHGSN